MRIPGFLVEENPGFKKADIWNELPMGIGSMYGMFTMKVIIPFMDPMGRGILIHHQA